MNCTKKELKMCIRYLKRALKFMKKVYKWSYNPFHKPLEEITYMENELYALEKTLKEME